jgi:phosphoglycolate phosphatase-like HAD superfamily hydrolase
LRLEGTNLGKTDIGILKEVFEFNEISFSLTDLKNCVDILNNMSDIELKDSINLINPGISDALNFCRDLGITNSVLTGNTKERALIKLGLNNLDSNFDLDLGFFGEIDFSRQQLVQNAKNYLNDLDNFEIVLIGDTPLDIVSAKENQLKVIGVSSGSHSFTELAKFNPDLLIHNFEENKTDFKNFIKELIKI